MKKTLTFFLSLLLMLQLSCDKQLGVTDFRFTPEVSYLSGEIFENETGGLETYTNTPISLSLKIDSKNTESMDYQLKYDMISGGGTVTTTENITLSPGNMVPHDFSNGTYNIIFTPTRAEATEIRFTLANDGMTKTISYKVFVREPAYYVSFSNLPDRKIINQKFSFDIDILEVQDSKLEQVATYSRVTKGSGDIYISDQIVAENDKPTLLKIGSSTVSYLPKELDENIVLFLIDDEHGVAQKVPISFTIEKPTFDISVLQDAETYPVINKDYSFKVNINKKEHPTNTFKLSYRFITGTGTLQINGKSVEVGGQIDALSGDNIFILNTPDSESISIEIIVTDAFDTQTTTIFNANIGEHTTDTDIEASASFPDAVKIGEVSDFTLFLEQEYFTGDFTVKYNITTGSGTLRRNGVAIPNNSTITLSATAHDFTFAPTSTGDNTFNFTVTDLSENSKEVTVTVIANNSTINASASTPSVVTLGDPSTFSLMFEAAHYVDPFSVKYNLMAGSGTLENGGNPIDNGGSVNLKGGTHGFTFIPTSTDKNTLKFTITDIHNQTEILIVNVTGNASALSASATTPNAVTVGQSATFIVNIFEEYYYDYFTVKYSLPTGEGIFKHNGTVINAGASFTVEKGESNFSFTPTKAGNNTINITVKDDHNQTKTLNVNVTANAAGLTASASTPNAVTLGTPSTFNVYLHEANYDDDFTVRYNLTAGSGTLKYGNRAITDGGTIELENGTHGFSFTPTKTSTNAFTLTVTDIHGQSKIININVTGTAGALSASASTPKEVVVGSPSSFNLSLREDNHPENFTVKAEITTGSGTINRVSNGGSIGLGVGTHDFTFTPTSTGNNIIRFTITDIHGQSKQVYVNVNALVGAVIKNSSSNPSAVTVGTPSGFNIDFSSAHYTGNFTISAKITSGSGVVKYGNTVISNGGSVSITGGNRGFSFTPSTFQTHTATITISNGRNSITHPITVNTLNSLKYQTSMLYENTNTGGNFYHKRYTIDLSADTNNGNEFEITLTYSYAGNNDGAGLFATSISAECVADAKITYKMVDVVSSGQKIRHRGKSLTLFTLNRHAYRSPSTVPDVPFTIKIKSVATGEEGVISDLCTKTMRDSPREYYDFTPHNIKKYGH